MQSVGEPAEVLILPVWHAQQKLRIWTLCNRESVTDEVITAAPLSNGERIANLLRSD